MRKGAQAGARGHAEGDSCGGAQGGAAGQHRPQDDACRNCGQLGHWAKDYQQSQRGQAHVAQVEELALFIAHASIELPPAATAAAALLHLDVPKAHGLLSYDSGNDKTDG